METLGSPTALCFNGCCTFSVNTICPTQMSVRIWTEAENFSTTLKCRISSPRRGTPSVPKAPTTLARMVLSHVDTKPLQTLSGEHFFLVQALTSNSGPVPSVMRSACQTPHQNCLNCSLQLLLRLENRKTFLTFKPLAVESEFDHQDTTPQN